MSENGHKYYNIKVTGKVLDVGFCTLVEDIAQFHDLRGYAFNDIDGSVKMVCCGETAGIDEFLDEVRFRGDRKGAWIEDIQKEELTQKIFLPKKFVRLYTDELADIGRKLDVGVEVLKEIKGDTSALVREMREHNKEQREHNTRLEAMVLGINEHNTRLEEMIHDQNSRLDGHNTRLEALLEKLVNK